MSAIVVRNISPETHRALRAQARERGRSTEAEISAILDGAVRPNPRLVPWAKLWRSFGAELCSGLGHRILARLRLRPTSHDLSGRWSGESRSTRRRM